MLVERTNIKDGRLEERTMANDHREGLGRLTGKREECQQKAGFRMEGEVGRWYPMMQLIRNEKCLLDWKR